MWYELDLETLFSSEKIIDRLIEGTCSNTLEEKTMSNVLSGKGIDLPSYVTTLEWLKACLDVVSSSEVTAKPRSDSSFDW